MLCLAGAHPKLLTNDKLALAFSQESTPSLVGRQTNLVLKLGRV